MARTGAFATLKENASVFRTRWVKVNPYGAHTAKMTRTGISDTPQAEASRRAALAIAPSREPDGFKSVRTGNIQQKSTPKMVCFLLVNLNQPKSNLFDFFMLIKKRIAKILRVIIANARFDNFN